MPRDWAAGSLLSPAGGAIRSLMSDPDGPATLQMLIEGEEVVEGVAVRFGVPSRELFHGSLQRHYRERVTPDAFNEHLLAISAGRRAASACWQHNRSDPLATSRDGFKLWVDAEGLHYRFPARNLSAEQRAAIQRGGMGASISFDPQISDQVWTEPALCELRNAWLNEVSVTGNPAHVGTTCNLRHGPPPSGPLTTALCRARTELLMKSL